VRIAREFELPGDEAVMHREGKRLMIEPAPGRSLLGVPAWLSPREEDFPPISELPADHAEL
jgi:antitoxin VapB